MQSETLQDVYEFASMFARQKGASHLECRHVLYAMSVVDNEAKRFLTDFGLNEQNLEPKAKGRGGVLTDSPEITYLNASAATIAEVMGDNSLNCIHTLIAMLSMKNTYAYNKLEFLLGERGSDVNKLLNHIVSNTKNGDKFVRWVRGGGVKATETLLGANDEKKEDDLQPASTTESFTRTKEDDSALPYGIDLTERAAMGSYDPVIGRDSELERVIQTLTRRSKNNPVLVGEAGVGKTAVVEGLACCIAEGHVPVELQGKRLVELDIAGMVAGTRYRGDFEERLTKLVGKVIEAGDVILFIDEIHNMVGAGGTGDGTLNAAEILKPALARGELRIIGATTTREYRQYIEKDPALERRFQPIMVEEPSPELAVRIVKGVRAKYENHHGVEITDEAVEAAVNLSVRYVTDRYLPDKAFDIIDEACSKLKISAYAVPPRLVELGNELKSVKRRLDTTPPHEIEQINALQRRFDELHNEFERIQSDYENQRKQLKCKLTAADVQLVVSEMTGIPVSELSREERDKLVHLEEELAERVIGQKQAVQAVARAVRRQRAGLKDPNKPVGSFVFVGPTGVGKTELAKALSQCLFGSDSEVIRIDMSEYMEKQSVSKLIGTAPGYVGYEESGYLTEKVQRKPYSVVLFDEIEKAHPDVFNILLQILDDGRITDSQGRLVDFKNTIIIMTSNLGANIILDGINADGKISDEAMDEVHKLLRATFRPELLNRIDEIITFSPLTKEQVKQIVDLLLTNVTKRLSDKQLGLEVTPKAKEHIVDFGYDVSFGARPLKRYIQHNVETAIAKAILTNDLKPNSTLVVDVKDNEITVNVK